MYIKGGTGNGYAAKVNNHNMLLTRSVEESIEHHINHEHGRGFSVTFSQSPTAGDDCFYWLKNTDTDRDLVLEGFSLGFINATAVDATVYLKIGDNGTANSPTTVTPVNFNSGAAYSATCTSQKGADLDNAGAGISGGTELLRYVFANVQDRITSYINFPMDIVLQPNGALSWWASDAGATYYLNVPFYFIDRD
jgi:hypothetical protein